MTLNVLLYGANMKTHIRLLYVGENQVKVSLIHTHIPMQKPPQEMCIMYPHTVSPLNSSLQVMGPLHSLFTYKPEICFCNLALHWIYFDTFYFFPLDSCQPPLETYFEYLKVASVFAQRILSMVDLCGVLDYLTVAVGTI